MWLFWQLSNYGRSTKRIFVWFFALAFSFGFIYYFLGVVDYFLDFHFLWLVIGYPDNNFHEPGIIANLFAVNGNHFDNALLVLVRSIYFSIVTMTTLGFGDVYANPDSYWGHAFLAFQVVLGYITLGALITRFAVLFSSSGPEKGL